MSHKSQHNKGASSLSVATSTALLVSILNDEKLRKSVCEIARNSIIEQFNLHPQVKFEVKVFLPCDDSSSPGDVVFTRPSIANRKHPRFASSSSDGDSKQSMVATNSDSSCKDSSLQPKRIGKIAAVSRKSMSSSDVDMTRVGASDSRKSSSSSTKIFFNSNVKPALAKSPSSTKQQLAVPITVNHVEPNRPTSLALKSNKKFPTNSQSDVMATSVSTSSSLQSVGAVDLRKSQKLAFIDKVYSELSTHVENILTIAYGQNINSDQYALLDEVRCYVANRNVEKLLKGALKKSIGEYMIQCYHASEKVRTDYNWLFEFFVSMKFIRSDDLIRVIIDDATFTSGVSTASISSRSEIDVVQTTAVDTAPVSQIETDVVQQNVLVERPLDVSDEKLSGAFDSIDTVVQHQDWSVMVEEAIRLREFEVIYESVKSLPPEDDVTLLDFSNFQSFFDSFKKRNFVETDPANHTLARAILRCAKDTDSFTDDQKSTIGNFVRQYFDFQSEKHISELQAQLSSQE